MIEWQGHKDKSTGHDGSCIHDELLKAHVQWVTVTQAEGRLPSHTHTHTHMRVHHVTWGLAIRSDYKLTIAERHVIVDMAVTYSPQIWKRAHLSLPGNTLSPLRLRLCEWAQDSWAIHQQATVNTVIYWKWHFVQQNKCCMDGTFQTMFCCGLIRTHIFPLKSPNLGWSMWPWFGSRGGLTQSVV